MRVPIRLSVLYLSGISVMVAGATPLATLAATGASGATGSNAAASATPARPRPDTDQKVWTNDDLAALRPSFEQPNSPDASQATSNQVPVIPDGAPVAVAPAAHLGALSPEQDPQWYARQMLSLEGQLASIDSEEQRIRNFQSTSAGIQTGLALNAPCSGITTDNFLAQLDAQRQQVLDQIDALGDTARRNGVEPGVLTEASGPAEASLSPDEQKTLLVQEFQQRSEELAQTREAVQDMQSQASAQNITLLPPSTDGGNMTNDLLLRLNDRQRDLQNQLDSVETDARSAGVEPGALR